LQAQIIGKLKRWHLKIPSNLNGMNKMYSHWGWVIFKGYGKKSRIKKEKKTSSTTNLNTLQFVMWLQSI
jgi:hypothetical protein